MKVQIKLLILTIILLGMNYLLLCIIFSTFNIVEMDVVAKQTSFYAIFSIMIMILLGSLATDGSKKNGCK